MVLPKTVTPKREPTVATLHIIVPLLYHVAFWGIRN